MTAIILSHFPSVQFSSDIQCTLHLVGLSTPRVDRPMSGTPPSYRPWWQEHHRSVPHQMVGTDKVRPPPMAGMPRASPPHITQDSDASGDIMSPITVHKRGLHPHFLLRAILKTTKQHKDLCSLYRLPVQMPQSEIFKPLMTTMKMTE